MPDDDDAKNALPVRFHKHYDRLCKILHDAMKLDSNQYFSIYFWNTNAGKPRIGTNMRIAEVTIITKCDDGGIGGSSYMQCDVPASGMIFRCERYLLQLIEPDIAGPEIKEELEAVEWQLREYIKQERLVAKSKS